MSLASIAAQLLDEAGVTASDILRESGVNGEVAVRTLANRLGVDLASLAESALPEGAKPVEISDSDVAKVREGLAVLNRAFS